MSAALAAAVILPLKCASTDVRYSRSNFSTSCALATLNGASNDSAGFSGVFTHEFGHSLNLRHSQANGAVQPQSVFDAPLPYGCTGPYPGRPGVGPNVPRVVTMYPFLDQRTTGTSRYMFTVDKMDDIQAISDLYPEPSWPGSHGTVKGTVNFLAKILGNGTGPAEQISGVNMIARNIADPYNDFVSTTTGEYTRGEGPPRSDPARTPG